MLALALASLPALAIDPGCATPQVLEALRGRVAPPHPFAVQAPARLGGPGAPPPGGERVIYGTPYDNHVETEHFTINWWTAGISEAAATAAGVALEQAWTALVDEQGWTPPVSSERFYLWVLLDPGLGGTTGYTTEYKTDLYPQGYPVIYLNPDYASDEAFWAALAAHEFAHALQYALRDWSGTYEGEAWYWEASATWSSELADPDVDGHQYTSAWYAEQPQLRYDSMEGSHQYGIFVFNAWLEEALTGAGGMKDAWDLSASRPGAAWDAILAESTGVAPGTLWSGFTAAYGAGALAESHLYTDPVTEGRLVDGVTGELPYLGTHYWRAEAEHLVQAEGDVILGGAEAGEAVEVGPRTVLAVTGLVDGASYTLRVEAPDGDGGADSGTTDGGADGGGAAGGDVDGGGDGVAGGDGGADEGASEGKGGCSALAGSASISAVMLALWGLARRRRTDRGPRPAASRSHGASLPA